MTYQLLPVGWLNTKCGRGGSRPQLFSKKSKSSFSLMFRCLNNITLFLLHSYLYTIKNLPEYLLKMPFLIHSNLIQENNLQ